MRRMVLGSAAETARRRLGRSIAALCGAVFCFIALTALACRATAQPLPNARPQGGQVVAGTAQISQTGTLTRIGQGSQRAAIDWSSFDVGSGQQVQFQQPSSSAVTLNRVTRPDPSQIAGKIAANGEIVLVNPSGVLFTKGAQVNAQGVVVSAAGITNKNFMAGHMVFDQPARPNATISNEGNITIKQAGLAALVAPHVKNAGVIDAKLGHVILAGAETDTLDLYGDGLLSIDVTGQVKRTPTGTNGTTVTALVTNTGTIRADGGTVLLTASAVDGVVQNLVTAGGNISTRSVGTKTGTIVLGGTGGSLVVQGTLAATGRAPGTTGGQIQVASTGDVTLAPTARVNASGRAGGGTIALGTTLARAKGGASVTPVVVARRTVIEKGAVVSADATNGGPGGRVMLLSAQETADYGTIDARGGPKQGDGGAVEISGQTLDLTGAIDAGPRAAGGAPGKLLLNPTDVTINHSNKGAIGRSTVGDQVINAAGQNAAVTIDATNSITVLGNNDPGGAASIQVNNPITLMAGGPITLDPGASIISASSTVTLAAGTALAETGGISIGAQALIRGQAINLNAGTDGISSSGSLEAGILTVNTTGKLAATAPNASTLTGAAASVDIESSPIFSISEIGPFTTTGGTFLLHNGVNFPLTVTGPLTATGDIALTSLYNDGGPAL